MTACYVDILSVLVISVAYAQRDAFPLKTFQIFRLIFPQEYFTRTFNHLFDLMKSDKYYFHPLLYLYLVILKLSEGIQSGWSRSTISIVFYWVTSSKIIPEFCGNFLLESFAWKRDIHILIIELCWSYIVFSLIVVTFSERYFSYIQDENKFNNIKKII